MTSQGSCFDDRYSTTRRVFDFSTSSTDPRYRSDMAPPRAHGGLRTRGLFKEPSEAGRADSVPLVTVITVVRNRAETLSATIESVLAQDYGNVEYIVIDGESRDGSIDILRKYEHAIDYWLSEADGGIYEAMNKGLDLARGDWIYFLGADDQLFDPRVLSRVLFSIHEDAQCVFGRISYDDGVVFDSAIDFRTNILNRLHHQSVLYRASLLQNFRYDTTYKIVADYELNFRIYRSKVKTQHLEVTIAKCGSAGISNTSRELPNYRDYFRIRSKYINDWVNCLFYVIGLANLVAHATSGIKQWVRS